MEINLVEHRIKVHKREEVMQTTANARALAIHARDPQRVPRLSAALAGVMASKAEPKAKIAALWRAADQAYGDLGDNVACHKGCSHCCHVAVDVTRAEAELIGLRIGRRPRNPPAVPSVPAEGPFGYHRPCTFLKDGACSIYASRPLMCRVQVNVDVDELMCVLIPPETSPVPYLDNREIKGALMFASGRDLGCADIRDYFPPRSDS